MYFKPENGVAADVIPFYDNGKFYLFYLKDADNRMDGIPWDLLITDNLIDYENCGSVLKSGGKEAKDYYVFTGSVIKKDDLYYIFYTGDNGNQVAKGKPKEVILRATSRDLVHWQKDDAFEISAPEGYNKNDFRDPFVFLGEDGRYNMLIAARTEVRPENGQAGLTVLYRSDDLNDWTLSEKPFYAPNEFFMHECPDLFKMGDKYYLLFSIFDDVPVTCYRMADSPFGPWTAPKCDTFDGRAFYAAKTASDGNKRYLFGWNPTKAEQKDDEKWRWGGNLVIHELIQNRETGELFVKCPDAVKNQYSAVFPATESDEKFAAKSADGYSRRNVSALPDCCRIELSVTTGKTLGEFGLFFFVDENFSRGYTAKFQSKFNRLCMSQKRRPSGAHSFETDTERYCPTEKNGRYDVTIIREHSILEIYVNDCVAMSARAFDFSDGYFGVYSSNSDVTFDDIKIFIK